MRRAMLTLFLPAFAYAPFFGPLAVFALAVMVLLTLCVGLPLLLLFKACTRMLWWQALFGGVLTTLPLVLYLLAGAGWANSAAYAWALGLSAMGALGGLLVWWVGIHGNPAFPEACGTTPRGSLSVFPLLLLGLIYSQALRPQHHVGCVLETDVIATPAESYGRAMVRLANESVISVPLSKGDLADDVLGLCVNIAQRRSWTLTGTRYQYRGLLPGTCGPGCS